MHRANRLLGKTMFGGGTSYQNSTVGAVLQQWDKKNNATIFLKRIKWVTGRSELESHFSKFGGIKDIAMFFDPATGLHRGHASITFDSAQSAEEAIASGPHHIDGAMITAHFDMPKPLDNMAHNKFLWINQQPTTQQNEPQQHYRPPPQQQQRQKKGRWSSLALGKSTVNSADGME